MESIPLKEGFPISQRGDENRQFSAGMLVDILWQSIRICGLAHDIGHLPMSHSLEGALKHFKAIMSSNSGEYFNGDSKSDERLKEIFRKLESQDNFEILLTEYEDILKAAYPEDKDLIQIKKAFEKFPIHERRSLYILHQIFKECPLGFEGTQANLRDLIYQISFLILFSSIKSSRYLEDQYMLNRDSSAMRINNSAFRFLKLILAGSVDGDRLDYTMRDGRACGTEIGKFDLEEIVNSATMFLNKEINEFKLGFYYRSVNSIERYFSERHQGYKHLIYHRTSSRTEATLQHLFSEIMQFVYKNPDDPISKYFSSLGFFLKESNGEHIIFPILTKLQINSRSESHIIDEVPYIDDAILRGFLEWLLKEVTVRKAREGEPKNSQFARMRSLLRIFLRRDYKHIYDPFKSSSATFKTKIAFESAIDRLDPSVKKNRLSYEYVRSIFVRNKILRSEMLKFFSNHIISNIDQDVSFISSTQEPKIYNHKIAINKGEEVYLVYNGVSEHGAIPNKPIINSSSYLKNMPELFNREFRYNCYFVYDSIKMNDSMTKKLDELIDTALKEAAYFAVSKISKIGGNDV